MTYFSYTSFARRAYVEISCDRDLQNVVIRPQILNIKFTTEGRSIRFLIDKTAQLSVEINGDIRHPLLVFANPPEDHPPKPGPGGVRYFEAGRVHNPGRIELKSGEVLYIAGGAIVNGSVFMDHAKNVHILGRGILLGSIYKPEEARMIEIDRSQDVSVEGIIIADSKHWTVPIIASDRVLLQNVKIVSGNNWDDGVDIVGSRDVTVDQCFIRTKDDCVAIKAGVEYFTNFTSQRDVRNVRVKRNVLWNGEWGNGLEIGFETRTEEISNIRFTDNDLIHVEGPEGTFTIHNGDRATVRDVVYENCRVEDSKGLLIDFKILSSKYSKDRERGHIENIQFKRIRVTGAVIPSILQGFDATHSVAVIRFGDFQVNGNRWRSLEDGRFKVKHAVAVTFH